LANPAKEWPELRGAAGSTLLKKALVLLRAQSDDGYGN
jgi:hypothetical protein